MLHGVVMRSLGLEIMGQGAMTLTVHLSELMHQSGLRFASLYTARTLKEVSLNLLILLHHGYAQGLDKQLTSSKFGSNVY